MRCLSRLFKRSSRSTFSSLSVSSCEFFCSQNIFMNTKDSLYYKITDDPTIQICLFWVDCYGVVYIILFLFFFSKKRNKSAKKSITPYIIWWQQMARWIWCYCLYYNANKTKLFFLYFVVSVPLLYSRCFRNHHNLFYEIWLKRMCV